MKVEVLAKILWEECEREHWGLISPSDLQPIFDPDYRDEDELDPLGKDASDLKRMLERVACRITSGREIKR